MLVHRRVTLSISQVPMYTPGWREALKEKSVLPKNTTRRPPTGSESEPGPLDPESRALTMTPPRRKLHFYITLSYPSSSSLLKFSNYDDDGGVVDEGEDDDVDNDGDDDGKDDNDTD